MLGARILGVIWCEAVAQFPQRLWNLWPWFRFTVMNSEPRHLYFKTICMPASKGYSLYLIQKVEQMVGMVWNGQYGAKYFDPMFSLIVTAKHAFVVSIQMCGLYWLRKEFIRNMWHFTSISGLNRRRKKPLGWTGTELELQNSPHIPKVPIQLELSL